VTSLVIALATLVLLLAGYLLDRRINQAVRWSAVQQRGSHSTTVVVTNTGTSKARGVTVSLEPEPPMRDEGEVLSTSVDPGATVNLSYRLTLGGGVPHQVTVRWRRMLRRDGVWTTPI
jgi:hypothetical protein